MRRWFAWQRWRHKASAFSAAFALSRIATADVEPIHIEYSAVAECPASADFSADVLRRTSRARLAEAPEAARTFVVVIERRGGHFVGSLSVREVGGTTTAREMTGERCAEVASALALATSLAIDPNAVLDPDAGATNDAGQTPKPPPENKPPPGSDDSEGRAEPTKPPRKTHAFSLALGPSAATGIAPKISLGGALELAWGKRTPTAEAPMELLSSVGISLAYLKSLSNSTDGATSSFDFATARPELCTIGLPFADDFALWPCLGAELGAVIGRGSNIAEASTRSRFWFTLDALIALRGYVSERWFLEASGGPVFPLTRYRFVFRDPDTPVHDVPVVGFEFGAKLGARLE